MHGTFKSRQLLFIDNCLVVVSTTICHGTNSNGTKTAKSDMLNNKSVTFVSMTKVVVVSKNKAICCRQLKISSKMGIRVTF